MPKKIPDAALSGVGGSQVYSYKHHVFADKNLHDASMSKYVSGFKIV